MYFKNEAHKTAFVHAAKKANAKDRRMMCKCYLSAVMDSAFQIHIGFCRKVQISIGMI